MPEEDRVKRTLLASVNTRKLRYFGHVTRHNYLEKTLFKEVYQEARREEGQKQHG